MVVALVVVVVVVVVAVAAAVVAVVAVVVVVAAAAAAAVAVVGAPPYPSYSVCLVCSSCHTTSSCLQIHFVLLTNSASDSVGGGSGDVDVQAACDIWWKGHLKHHLKSKPSYAEVWALRMLASPARVQLASLFLVFIRCCASGFGSVATLFAAPAFCTVFTAFSYYPTTCGLAVSSPSSLQLQLLSQFWGLSLCNFTGCDS